MMKSQFIYKGVEYEIAPIEPGLWKWQFRIGGRIKTGKTKANLELLASRRVQLVINQELRGSSPDLQRAAE